MEPFPHPTGSYSYHLLHPVEGHPLADQLGINAHNLSLRREYLDLGNEDARILEDCVPFATGIAPVLAHEFYDIQFTFLPTARFFADQAVQRGIPLADLRAHLELIQAACFLRMFTGAKDLWNVDYFEDRLRIGVVHEQLHVPLKWHMGAYSVYTRLMRKHVYAAFPAERAGSIMHSMSKVLHLDMQAVADSFMAATIVSMGLDMGDKPLNESEDLTDRFGTLRQNAEMLLRQTETIARGGLADPLLESRVPGRLGRACHTLITFLRKRHPA